MTSLLGEADLSRPAAMLADPARARMLVALCDGRALAASVLAGEAGVAASTASEHLGKLVAAGLVTVHPQGRHRYYRLAGPHVAALVETLSALAPVTPVRSLREGSRAHALRQARTCYDHLAGRLGVALFRALLDTGAVAGGDGVHQLGPAAADRLAAPGRDVAYALTTAGVDLLGQLAVRLPAAAADGTVPLRYCVDWSEQRHHLSGAVGRALCDRLLQLRWLVRGSRPRALRLTDTGRTGLAETFGIRLTG